MKRLMLVTALSALSIPALADDGFAPQAAFRPSPTRLAQVKRVYVDRLGNGDGSEMVRQKLIDHLIKCAALQVMDSPATADATLTGAAEMRHRNNMNSILKGKTKFSAGSAVRLISRDGQILWTDEERSGGLFTSHKAYGASTNVAGKIATQLLDDIERDRKQLAATEKGM